MTLKMQLLQAVLVRTTGTFEIDAKIKNSSFLYINRFSPKTRQNQILSQGNFRTNLIQTKPSLQRIETYLKLIQKKALQARQELPIHF